ncbi:MAG: 6-bladed beta-propeller, partial [Candidatus Aminicenantes bacterium]
KGKWDFRMKKAWEIEEAGDDVIGSVQNIKSAHDGRIYIVDSKNHKIYIFSKEGRFVSSFGERGEGPGEIKNFEMGEQLFVVDQSVIVVDRARISYFSLDGTFKKSLLYSTQMRPRTFFSEEVFISAPVSTVGLRDKTAKIKWYHVIDRSEKIIAEFRPFKEAAATNQSGGRQVTVVAIFGGVTPIMIVKHRNGKVYYGMSNTYAINRLDLKSKKTLSFSIDGREPKEITPAVKKELAKGLGDVPRDMLERIMDGLPEKASFFQDIEIDKNGLIYVFLSNPTGEPLQAVDIFSPEGKYLYSSQLRVEEGLSIQAVYLRDHLLVIAAEDEEGTVKVTKYSVQLPVL